MKTRDKDKLANYNLLRKKTLVAIAGLKKMRTASHTAGRTFIAGPELETEIIEPIEKLYEILFGEKTPEDKAVEQSVNKSFEEHEKFAGSQPLISSTGSVWKFIKRGLAIATVGGTIYVAWQANKRKKETPEK